MRFRFGGVQPDRETATVRAEVRCKRAECGSHRHGASSCPEAYRWQGDGGEVAARLLRLRPPLTAICVGESFLPADAGRLFLIKSRSVQLH